MAEEQEAPSAWDKVKELESRVEELLREIQSSHEVLDGLNVPAGESVHGILNENLEKQVNFSLVNRIVKLGIREADMRCIFKPGLR